MRFYFLLFLFFFTILYLSTFYIVQIPYSRNYFLNNFFSMCTLYSNPFQVARLYTKGPFTISYQDYYSSDCNGTYPVYTPAGSYWEMLERPIVGDHIHLLYKIRVNNTDMIFHDRDLTETIDYETPPTACPSTKNFAYKKQWFHTGIHSHCDSPGIIHVHPWSSPEGLKFEGRDATLGIFFQSIGIERNTKNYGFLVNGSYVKFNLAYFTNKERNSGFVTQDETEIENLWLVDCHGIVLLWDEKSKAPDVTEKDIEFLESFKCYPNNYPLR